MMQCKTTRTKAQRRFKVIGENGKPRKRAKRCPNTAMQDGWCHWCLLRMDRVAERRALRAPIKAVIPTFDGEPLAVELVWGATNG